MIVEWLGLASGVTTLLDLAVVPEVAPQVQSHLRRRISPEGLENDFRRTIRINGAPEMRLTSGTKANDLLCLSCAEFTLTEWKGAVYPQASREPGFGLSLLAQLRSGWRLASNSVPSPDI